MVSQPACVHVAAALPGALYHTTTLHCGKEQGRVCYSRIIAAWVVDQRQLPCGSFGLHTVALFGSI